MSRPLRFQPSPKALFEVTCRTVQGRPLLMPSAEHNDLVRGVIGRALDRFAGRVDLYSLGFLTNHMHMNLGAENAKDLSDFMGYCESNIAREVGHLHGWSGPFWARRFTAIAVLDAQAMIERLRYHLSHGVKEGLVGRVLDWAGLSCARALMFGERLCGTWYDRTALNRARRKSPNCDPSEFATVYEIPIQPLPCWSHLTEAERQDLVRKMVDSIDKQAAARIADTGRAPLGMAAVLKQDPQARPAHVKTSRAPACHATLREMRAWFAEKRRAFERAFRVAARLLRSGGVQDAVFPPCSFPPGLPFVPFGKEPEPARRLVFAASAPAPG